MPGSRLASMHMQACWHASLTGSMPYAHQALHCHVSNEVSHACVAQGPAGCQQMQWRNEPGGYLREILTAKVYDVAVCAHMYQYRITRLGVFAGHGCPALAMWGSRYPK